MSEISLNELGVRRRATRRFLEGFGVAALGAYCAWWGYWLMHGKLPVAPIRAMAGLPAPSTGCIRSLQSLWRGDVAESLRWNVLGVPMTILLAASVGILMWEVARGRPLRLPGYFLWLWVVVLGAAWVAKFVVGSQYW